MYIAYYGRECIDSDGTSTWLFDTYNQWQQIGGGAECLWPFTTESVLASGQLDKSLAALATSMPSASYIILRSVTPWLDAEDMA